MDRILPPTNYFALFPYSKLPPKPSPKKVKEQYKGELSGSDNPLLDCSTRAQSEEEETWSLPGIMVFFILDSEF